MGCGQRGQLQPGKLGPTVVLGGPGRAPWGWQHRAWAEAAGQWAQRMAYMEAINTDRPGTGLQASRPGGEVRIGHWLCLPRALSPGPWALGTAYWDREARGVRTPSLPDGKEATLSLGSLAFPSPQSHPCGPGQTGPAHPQKEMASLIAKHRL